MVEKEVDMGVAVEEEGSQDVEGSCVFVGIYCQLFCMSPYAAVWSTFCSVPLSILQFDIMVCY